MEFVKDLLVSVVRYGEEIPQDFGGTSCLFIANGEAPSDQTSLLALKGYLERALDEIDREGETFIERMRPRTLAQIEMLQAKFDDAQAELEQLKSGLLET